MRIFGPFLKPIISQSANKSCHNAWYFCNFEKIKHLTMSEQWAEDGWICFILILLCNFSKHHSFIAIMHLGYLFVLHILFTSMQQQKKKGIKLFFLILGFIFQCKFCSSSIHKKNLCFFFVVSFDNLIEKKKNGKLYLIWAHFAHI